MFKNILKFTQWLENMLLVLYQAGLSVPGLFGKAIRADSFREHTVKFEEVFRYNPAAVNPSQLPTSYCADSSLWNARWEVYTEMFSPPTLVPDFLESRSN